MSQVCGFCDTQVQHAVQEGIEHALQNLEELRGSDYVGSMLWMQQFKATEYFSRWIELKETGSG